MRKYMMIMIALFMALFSACGDSGKPAASSHLTVDLLMEQVNGYIESNNSKEKYNAHYVEPVHVDEHGKIKTEYNHMDYSIGIDSEDAGIVTGWHIHFIGQAGTYKISMMSAIYGLNYYVESFIAASFGSDWEAACDDYEAWAQSGFMDGAYETEIAKIEYSSLTGGDFTASYNTSTWFIDVDCIIKQR